MQPNKSVEETAEGYLMEMYELGHGIGSGTLPMEYAHKRSNELVELSKNLFTSHTNTVLQGVVERVEGKIAEQKVCSEGMCGCHNKVTPLQELLSLLNDQIISNEEKK